LEFVSTDKTAERLGLSPDHVFHMRHKLLAAIGHSKATNPTGLSVAKECDETFVLERLTGRKIPADYWRGARKHGTKAQ